MSARTPIAAYFRGILSGVEFLDAQERVLAKIDFPNLPGQSAKLEFGDATCQIVHERHETGRYVPDRTFRVVSADGAVLAVLEIRIPPSGSVKNAETRMIRPVVLTLAKSTGFFRKSVNVKDSEGIVAGSLYEPSFFSVGREFVVDLPDSVPLEAKFLLAYVLILRDFFATSTASW